MKYQIKLTFFLLGILLIGGTKIYSQEEFPVTGIIVNSSGVPVEGVSVTVEGQSMSPLVTGADGRFSVQSETNQFWIIFTPYEKYKTKREFFSGPKKQAIIYLTDIDLESGDDIILDIGFDKERKNVIASTHTINTENFNYLPYQSAGQFFQGNVPGVLFTGHSGMPGSGGSIFLRGQTSLTANNMPLIIVDGIPLENGSLYNPLVTGYSYSPLSVISPQDISAVSVLRGAAASLYGAKGSNGVILIETLNPTDVNTTIEFTLRTGINLKGKELPQLNARQHKTLANEVLTSSGLPEETYNSLAPGLFLAPGDEGYINYSHDYNWQDEVFTNSFIRDAWFNIKGGDAIGRYGLSVGYTDHEGIFRNTGFNRFTSRFVGTFNMFEWLRVSVSANLATSTSLVKESGLSRQASPIIASLFKSPLQFPYQYDKDGNRLSALQDVDELGVSNTRAITDVFDAKNSNTRFLTSIKADGDITQRLKFSSLLALNSNSLRQNAFYPNHGMEYYGTIEVWNLSQVMTGNLFSMYNDNFLTWSNNFNNKHRLSLTAGAKWWANRFEQDLAVAKNLNPNDQFVYLQAGVAALREIGGDIKNWNWFSGYTRVNYAILERYFFELNASGELSSNVGRQAKNVFLINNLPYATFYSGAFSWRLSEENFMRGNHFLDNLSLTLQYGLTGNDDTGTTGRHDFYKLMLYRETSGMIPSGYGNPALGFEKSALFSAGANVGILGNRHRASFEYYNTQISDMIVFEKLSSYIGYDSYPSNNASMVNRGLEFNLFSRVFTTGKWNLDVGFNIAKIENEITQIKGGEIITDLPGYSIINRVGAPANSFFGYLFEGVFVNDQEANAANLVNGTDVPFRAGDARFKDISGPGGIPDGVINNYDKVVLGSGFPDYAGGVNFSVSWKNWNLQTLWQFVYGIDLFNYVRFQNEKMADLSNQSITVLRRWSYNGHETDIPKAKWGDPVGNSAFSSRWIEDGSYLRCKDVMLSYKVPGNQLFFRELTVFANAVNLLTFSNYLGYDPEFSFSTQSGIQGTDYGLMPHSRKVMIGFKIGL
jgi:TonB-linked SusC/RagA family outer membrane protein